MMVLVGEGAEATVNELREALGGCGQVARVREAGVASAVEEAADGAVEIVGVSGGSALVAEVGAALANLGARGAGLRVLPLPGAGTARLCAELGIRGSAVDTVERVAALSRKGAGLRRKPPQNVMRRMLRVSSSALPCARFGFALGMGRMAEVLEGDGGRRTMLRLAREIAGGARSLLPGASADKASGVRVVVNRAPFAEALEFSLATTLGSVPGGLKPFDGPIAEEAYFNFVWADTNTMLSQGAMAMLASRRVLKDSYRVVRATSVDVSLAEDIVLDGVRIGAEGPYALGIRPGPLMPLVVV